MYNFIYELLGQQPLISTLATQEHFITDQFVKDYDDCLLRMLGERDEQVRNMNDESISRLSTQQIKTINDVVGDMLDAFACPRL